MSFAGSVQDMINRIKDNRDLVQVRKDRTAKIRDLYVRSGHTQVRHEHEHLPVKEKEQIRDRIKNEYRRIFLGKSIFTYYFHCDNSNSVLFDSFEYFQSSFLISR